MAVAAATTYFMHSTGRTFHNVRANMASQVTGILPEDLRRDDVLSNRMTVVFLHLFVFRYLRLIVHLISFWLFYHPTPVPKNPALSPSDCTIILPTVDPKNRDFEECITSCLRNTPGAIIIVTVGDQLTKLTKDIIAPYKRIFPNTEISVRTADEANKRRRVAHGLRYVKTKITVLLDDHVVWPTERFLPTILAPFEDPKVGIVGTNKRVRRTDTGFNIRSFWNMLGALYLERHNFEIRATNAIDNGVFVVSGRTSAHRSEILKDPKFIAEFTNERFFFGLFGPLNADDDNFITRWDVRHGWKVKIQYCPDAMIETTLGTYPKFLSQCLRWVRTTWRSNSASLFTDRTVWYTQPWCVYAVYWTSFVNFALFYDGALAYTLLKSPLGTADNLKYLAAWIFCTKMVKLTPYFLREPQDLVMLPGYFAFAYFHSLIKLYAGLTFWETNWGGRNLSAVNTQTGGGPEGDDDDDDDDDDDADDSSDDSIDGGVQLPPTPPSSRRRKTAGSSRAGSGGLAVLCASRAAARTAEHAYEFKSVTITGGGYITGIVGHPTKKDLLYALTDIGSTYRWEQELNKWIPVTDLVGPEDENLLGTESVATDIFIWRKAGATLTRYRAPSPMGANELDRNNGERLAVKPFKPNELWMGTRNAGLMKSSDLAKAWTNGTNFPDPMAKDWNQPMQWRARIFLAKRATSTDSGPMISTPRSRCSASLFLEPEHNLGVMTIDASGKYVISPSVQAETPPANDSGPYASNDGGKTWASPHGLTMQTPYISSDRVQPKTFYAFSGGVWYVSTDGGFSYDAVDATKLGLPAHTGAVPVVSADRAGEIGLALGSNGGTVADLITVGAAAPGSVKPALFIRGSTGHPKKSGYRVYQSDDNASTWDGVDDDDHCYGEFDLIQEDPRVYGRVYLGTGGRGLLYADIGPHDQARRGMYQEQEVFD
ncbi:hypothetical protein KXX32_008778 [Aspergillus fumigatus]|nr:hypothetical protein KXX32_008778 [Aspergillus fumigatus]